MSTNRTYIIVLLLISISLYSFFYFFFGRETILEKIIKIEKNKEKKEAEEKLKTDPMLGGKNRFQWYREHYGKEVKVATNSTREVSMLYAYEFEHEYSVSLTNWNLEGYKVYCRYEDSSGNELFPSFESLTYPEYHVHCEKRQNASKIAITHTSTEPFTAIPILPQAHQKYKLSICVTPFFGSEPKWLLLSELIEHYKLHGVEHFYLYMYEVSGYDLMLINDYQRTGEVEVHYLLDRDAPREDKEWQMVHIKDCHLRSKIQSEWTIFADLDERIVMNKGNSTILEYLENTRKDETIGAVRFQQQWVLKTEAMPEKYEGGENLLPWLPTHRYHNSTAIGPPGHTVKCIIRSETVFIMWVHDIWAFLPDKGYHLVNVDPKVGNVRHYRDQTLGDWGNRWLKNTLKYGPLRNTDYPNQFFLKKLTENVLKRIDYVYGNERD